MAARYERYCGVQGDVWVGTSMKCMGMAMVQTTRGNDADTGDRRVLKNFLIRIIHRTEQNTSVRPAQERPQSVAHGKTPDMKASSLYSRHIHTARRKTAFALVSKFGVPISSVTLGGAMFF